MADVLLTFDGDLSPIERKINSLSNRSVKLDLKNNLSQPLGRITADVSEFNKSLEASNARVLAFGASAGAVYAVQRAFSEIVKSTIEVEKSLADINAVLGSSGKTLADFGRSLFDVAKNTGSSFSQVASAATELSRQGLSVQETLKRTSDALILTRLSGLDAAKSVEALTAAVNSFGRAGLTTTEIVNKFATVDAAFAVSSADLAEAISRVGSTAQDVGVSLDQLIGLVTAAQQTTARGGAVIGNSFKTIFTRIQRGDTLDQLEQMGIKVRDLQGNALPAVQVLQNLAGVFNTLSSAQKSSLAETVGGVYQMNILRATLGDLSKQYSTYGSALNTSLSATDQAKRRNEELNQTLASMINKTMVNFKQASAEIGNLVFAPTIKTGTNALDSILADFAKPEEARSAGGQIATQLLKGIGEFLQGPGVTLIGSAFIKIFAGLTSFSAQAFKGLMGITSSADQLAAAQTRINSILSQNPNLIQAIISKNASLIQVENQLLQIIEKQNQARVVGSQLSTKMAPAVVAAETMALSAISKTGTKRKAGGFIPNFALDPEIDSANKLGYYPSKSFEINHPILGKTTVNDKEKTNAVQVGDYPPGSFIVNPKQENMMKGIPLTDIVNYARGYIPNFENTPKIVNAQNFATMLVPQGGGSSQYQFKNKQSGKPGVTVTWPVAGLNTKYKDNQVMTNIAEQAENVASRLMIAFANSIRPPSRQIGEGEVQTKINEAGGARGSINSFAGAVFEAGIKLGLDYKAAQKEGIDFDVIGGSAKLKDLFPALRTQLADFKVNQNSDANRKSMAEKILKAKNLGYMTSEGAYDSKKGGETIYSTAKRKMREKPLWRRTSQASGFIPNFIEEGDMFSVMESMTREQEALKSRSGGRVKLGQDSRLISSENPNGYGVYNTLDEPTGLGEGIARYNSLSEARKAGKSKGFIPNFANDRIDPNKEKNDKIFTRLLALSFIGAQGAAYGADKLDTLGGQSAYVGGKALESAATGATISDLLGGKGMITAVAATAITGFVKAINDIELSKGRREIEELNKKAGAMADQINKLSASSQDFTTKLEQMNLAMEEGKDTSQIKNALLDVIKTLPLEQQKIALQKFQQNPNEVPEYLNQAQVQMAANKNDLLMAAQFKAFNPPKVGLGDKFANFLGGDQTFLGRQMGLYFGTETKNPLTDKENVKSISSGLMANIMAANLSPEQTTKLSQDISSSKSIEDFVNALKKVSEQAGIGTKSLEALQGMLNQFPQSADRAKMATLEMIKANLQAEKEKLKSGLTQTQVTENYKGAAQLLNYDYLQSPFGKESQIGQLSSAGIMFAGINPFQDKSKTGQAALQASSILGNMGMTTQTIGNIFPDIKEKSLKFLSDSFDKQTEDIVNLGNTGILGRFNEEEFRKSRANIKPNKIAEAAYKEKNPVDQGQVSDTTKMGTFITEANTKLNDTINASMTALDQTISNLDKTIADLAVQIEKNTPTETAQDTAGKKNPTLDLVASALKSDIGTGLTAVGAGVGIKGLFDLLKARMAGAGATALGTAATTTAAAAETGAVAAGAGAAATGAAATGAGAAAATGAAIGATTILAALATFLTSAGVGYMVSEKTGLGEKGGETLYNLLPDLFNSLSGANKYKLTPEEQKAQDEALANRNKKDLQTPKRIAEGDACCREEIDIQRQILNTIIEIKNFLPNIAKGAYIGGVTNIGTGGSSQTTVLGTAMKNAGLVAQEASSQLDQVVQNAVADFQMNSNNMINGYLGGNASSNMISESFGQMPNLNSENQNVDFNNLTKLPEKESVYSLSARASNMFNNQMSSEDKDRLYAHYNEILKNPAMWKEPYGTGKDEDSPAMKIAEKVNVLQTSEGFRNKEQRLQETRRTGFVDSGFDKGYKDYEPWIDPTKPGGLGIKIVPEPRVLSRNINKRGMIENRMADRSTIGLESEIRQKEKDIFMEQASKKYAEQARERRLKAAEIGGIKANLPGQAAYTPMYKEGTDTNLTKEDLASGQSLAKEIMTSYLNQKGKDKYGKTGFENLQANNRVNAPEVPAPFMNWKQETQGRSVGKITAAPGSVTPPSFMNENSALPVAPETIQGPYMFMGKQKFLNPFKSLFSDPEELFTDAPVMGMGNMGANARDYGRGMFGTAAPPILQNRPGKTWDPKGPFDIINRYLKPSNVTPGNLDFKDFYKQPQLSEPHPEYAENISRFGAGMLDYTNPNTEKFNFAPAPTTIQQPEAKPLTSRDNMLEFINPDKAKEKAGDERWNKFMDTQGWKEPLGGKESYQLSPMAQMPGDWSRFEKSYNKSDKEDGQDKVVKELEKISKNTETQRKQEEKSQIEYQKTPEREKESSKDKKDETKNQREDPNAKTAEMLQQLTNILSTGFSKMTESKDTQSRKSESEGQKGGGISVNVSANSNVSVSAKMDPGEIEGKIRAIVSQEISQLQSRIESKISALQGSPQPPKGKGASPSPTVA